MRVGILTLHSQTNYGAVLQAFALKSALADMGHDVRVIDRWRDDDCARLKGILASRSPAAWLKWLKGAVSWSGVVAELRRRLLPYGNGPEAPESVAIFRAEAVWHGRHAD